MSKRRTRYAEVVRDSGNDPRSCVVQANDLRAIVREVGQIREICRNGYMAQHAAIKLSTIAKRVETIARAYLEPQLPGVNVREGKR